MAFIKRRRIAVSFVLPYAPDVGCGPVERLLRAPGVLLAALIVVTLTEGLSGLNAPARNASPTATPGP